jgi:biopolymer transport protein ExbD
MSRFRTQKIHEPALIASINTTPLIDVLLVLLIMMILSIPAPTHKVAVDLPSANPNAVQGPPPPVNRLDIAQTGAISWNGELVETGQLTPLLAAHVADKRAPMLYVYNHPEGNYDRFDRTLALVKKAGVKQLSFVGIQDLPETMN